MNRVIYVVDVGSPQAGLAWARLEVDHEALPTGSADLAFASERIAADLRSGAPVAIGFEAPGFLPVPIEISLLGKARTGEVRGNTSRPWSYGAGAYVTTMAIHVGSWLLRDIRMRLSDNALPRLTLDPKAWAESAGVLLWEAFVSGPGHAREKSASGVTEHIQDAATAAAAFRAWWSEHPHPLTAVSCSPRINTFGAMALWAGWTDDVSVLAQECLVLWPDASLPTRVLLDSNSPSGLVAERSVATAPNASVGASDRAVGSHEGGNVHTAPGAVALICGDSHSFWRSHQGIDEAKNFEVLAHLLRSSPAQSRRCDVTFDGGATWIPLLLRLVSGTQISWKGHNASASTSAKVRTFIRA
jgi:hypothetical protein